MPWRKHSLGLRAQRRHEKSEWDPGPGTRAPGGAGTETPQGDRLARGHVGGRPWGEGPGLPPREATMGRARR